MIKDIGDIDFPFVSWIGNFVVIGFNPKRFEQLLKWRSTNLQPARSKASDSESGLVGVRAFESNLSH